LSGGLAVERWRARYPATAERLETEPPRLGITVAGLPTPRPGRRPTVPRCEAPRGSARPGRGPESASAALRLDLNRATPGELARLVGISWGLAARIVAARDAVEPAGPGAPVGPRRRFARFRRGEPPAPPAEVESAPTTDSDPEPLDGASDTPPQ
jgi:hypothetical protein